MLKQTVMIVTAACVLTVALAAQDRPSPARPAIAAPQPTPPSARTPQPTAPREQAPAPTPAPARAPEPLGQPVNIKLEITITDQAGPGDPSKKTITMMLADRTNGGIRSSGTQAVTSSGMAPVSINVDAAPTILKDGAVRLQLGLEYQPRPSADPSQAAVPPSRMSTLNERITVIAQDGKPLTISQAADPGSDRKIMIELRATVLK
jgi:hypothetical protein